VKQDAVAWVALRPGAFSLLLLLLLLLLLRLLCERRWEREREREKEDGGGQSHVTHMKGNANERKREGDRESGKAAGGRGHVTPASVWVAAGRWCGVDEERSFSFSFSFSFSLSLPAHYHRYTCETSCDAHMHVKRHVTHICMWFVTHECACYSFSASLLGASR